MKTSTLLFYVKKIGALFIKILKYIPFINNCPRNSTIDFSITT